jgi:hypothetical protein
MTDTPRGGKIVYHRDNGWKKAGPPRPAIMPSYIICAHQILANVLITRDEIRLDKFREIAQGLQRAVPCAYVNATNRSVSCALEDYPATFERRGDNYLGRVTRPEKDFTEASVDFWFNDQMPENVRLLVKQYFERLAP